MVDNGTPIQIEASSSEKSIFEDGRGNYRFLLGTIQGEFSNLSTEEPLYVSVYFKRNVDMEWESITFQLNSGERIFKQQLPAGLLVITFYISLFGWITKDFELTDLKIAVKEIPIGKFGGSTNTLTILDKDEEKEAITYIPSDERTFVAFEIKIAQVGDLQANSATVVWATTHKATSKVAFGNDADEMNEEVYSSDHEYYHTVLLEGLDLEQKYYCRIYSVSEDTGEELFSDIMEFTTGKEISFTADNLLSSVSLTSKTTRQLSIGNPFNIPLEKVITIDPDRSNVLENEVLISAHSKVELNAQNLIQNEYDYE